MVKPTALFLTILMTISLFACAQANDPSQSGAQQESQPQVSTESFWSCSVSFFW